MHRVNVNLHMCLLSEPPVANMTLKGPLFFMYHFDVLLHHAFV